MDSSEIATPKMREVRFAIVRPRGENERDRIACVSAVSELATHHGATIEALGEICILTYGAIVDAPESEATMLSLVHDLCACSRPASVVYGARRCLVGDLGSDQRVSFR